MQITPLQPRRKPTFAEPPGDPSEGGKLSWLGYSHTKGCSLLRLFVLVHFMLTTEQIKELIRTGRTAEFYHDKAWEKLSKRIRKEQTECWFCKQHGKVGPADLVHHRYELKQYPEYAYARYYTDALGTRHINLVAVCFACHEEQHGRGYAAERKHYTNAERW